jgi:hypothetical protein
MTGRPSGSHRSGCSLAGARGPFGSAITRDDAETLSIIAAFLELESDEVTRSP